jgi:hypothetical protein
MLTQLLIIVVVGSCDFLFTSVPPVSHEKLEEGVAGAEIAQNPYVY